MFGRKINKYANQVGQNDFFLHKRNLEKLNLDRFTNYFLLKKNLYIGTLYNYGMVSLSCKNLRTFKNNDTKKFVKWKIGEVIKNSVIF